MDFEKYIKLGAEYFSEYFAVLIMTLRNPELRFESLSDMPSAETNILVLPHKTTGFRSGTRLNPKLISFVLLSILIGLSFQISAVGTNSFELITLVLFYLQSWLLFSFGFHLLCKILRGQGTFFETASVSLQLLATLFVVGSFAAFFWNIVVSPLLKLLGRPTIHSVYIFYLSILSSAVYFPIALGKVHRLTRTKQFLLGVIFFISALVWFFLGVQNLFFWMP